MWAGNMMAGSAMVEGFPEDPEVTGCFTASHLPAHTLRNRGLQVGLPARSWEHLANVTSTKLC